MYKTDQLLNELAENFDEDAIKSMLEPIVIAFVALSVKQYRGNLLLLHYKKIQIYTYIILSINT